MEDLIDTSIPKTINNKTDVFLIKVYTYIKENRNELGYPYGINKVPYLYMTNDLCGKCFQMMQLFIQKQIQFDVATFLDIIKALIDTYEDKHNDGCCSFYHSKPVEEIQELYNKLIETK